MTVYLPLTVSSPFPQTPHFLVPSAEPTAHMQKVLKALLKAKRIAVVCGAGISVQAGIPDFRSETGLFQTLKRDHSSLSSGKDLFDASVFNSEVTTSLFCQMISQLSQLSKTAQPTAFHHLLRALDDRGRLLRVYTQNIDALELKTGLTFGVPELEAKRSRPRSVKGKSDNPEAPAVLPSPPAVPRLLTPPAETPRCIPLHGTLQSMYCQICQHSFPLENYLGDLNSGSFPICPDCDQVEETRQAVGKRSRGVGKLRPSVVLYNEMHKDGEEVGEVVRRDLVGNSKGKGRAGADLLLVVGTSLRVPGTKRMVREFSKAVHSRYVATSQNEATAPSPSSSTLPSPRRTPVADEDTPIKTIYLNLDFPVPTREWEGVFDVWIRGDAQTFAAMVHEEIAKEERAKEAAIERKKKREEMKEEARMEEERRRQEAEALADVQAKKSKAKLPTKPSSSHSKKRKEPPGLLTPPCSVKRQRTKASKQASPRKCSFKKKPHSIASPTSPHPRLTIKIPPRPRTTSAHVHEAYAPLTPPSSQDVRMVPEVVITTSPSKPQAHSKHKAAPNTSSSLLPQMYYSSSPLSTPPITPPYCTASPVTSCASSAFSSPLTSILSSPVVSPLRSPPYSPFASPTPPPRRRRPSAPTIHKRPDQVTRISEADDTEENVDIDGGCGWDTPSELDSAQPCVEQDFKHRLNPPARL